MKVNREGIIASVVYNPEEALHLLSQDDLIAFDLETTGLCPWKNDIALMQFFGNITRVPILIRIKNGVVPYEISQLFSLGKTFIGHNATAFDLIFLATHGVPWDRSKWYDTLTGECIISTTGRRDVSKSLRESVRRRLGLQIDKDIEHGKWLSKDLSDDQIFYAAEDVLHLLDLRESQIEKATDQHQLGALEMEMTLIPAVVSMTVNGLPLKLSVLKTWLEGQQNSIIEHGDALFTMVGNSFNLNSPKQIKENAEKIGIYLNSTTTEVLEDIMKAGFEPNATFAKHLIGHRVPTRRVSMYGREWQSQYIIDDWVHPRFWQAGTDTLRFSSSNPNIQQVPKDGRHIIGNLEGYSIVSADYSQIEVRIAATIGGDEAMNRILQQEDIHRGIAAQVFATKESQVTEDQRKQAKALTFALLFGGGTSVIYTYARALGSNMEMGECQQLFTDFFNTFTGLAKMRKRAFELAQHSPIITVILPNSAKRLLVGRNLTPQRILNTTVQGTAAIGLKYALKLAYDRGLRYNGATVHDEIVAVVPNKEVEEYSRELEKAMIEGMNMAVPDMLVKVGVKHGDTW
jgi:DNA polymerase I-like protein with 3'-5' exonuclease and polymerase domains